MSPPQQKTILDGVISFMFKDLQTLGSRQKSRKHRGKLFRRKRNERMPTREYEPFSANVSPVALERKNIDLSASL